MAQRTQSEASRKAGLLTAYFKAQDIHAAKEVATTKAASKQQMAYEAMLAARQKCADVGVKIED